MKKLLFWIVASVTLFFSNVSIAQPGISVLAPTCFSPGVTATCLVTGTVASAQSYTWTVISSCAQQATITTVNSTVALISFACCGNISINCTAYSASNQNLGSTNTLVTLTCPPPINIASNNTLVCFTGATRSLAASPGTNMTYSWSTGATGSTTSVFVITPTVISVTGTSTSGCTNTASVTFNIFTPTLNVTPTYTSICPNTSVALSASGANTYTWQGNQPFPQISVAPGVTTIYTVAATSISLGVVCLATPKTPTIFVLAPGVVSIMPIPLTPCAGATYSLMAMGANSYTWNTAQQGSVIVTTAPLSGVISYTVNGSSGACPTVSAQTAVQVQTASPIFITPSNTVCEGQGVTLTASGAQSYTWNNNATTSTISVLAQNNATFSVLGTGTGSCASAGTFTLSAFPVPTIAIASASLPLCSATTVTLTASGAQTYVWSNFATGPTTTLTPVSGVYSVTGQSSVGCVSTISVQVTVNPTPTIAAVANTTFICRGSKVTLSPAGGSSYSWTPGTATGTAQVSPTVTTIYTVTGESSLGCMNMATVAINVGVCPGFASQTLDSPDKLFPNPCSDRISIVHTGDIQLDIYSLDGKLLVSKIVTQSENVVDVSELPGGFYLIRFGDANAMNSIKLLKQ